MNFRISPLWWPGLALTSPVLLCMLMVKHRRFTHHLSEARKDNRRLLAAAVPLALPELERLDLTVLLEEFHKPGFGHAPGISYHLKTELGGLLFDLGYGDEESGLDRNIRKMRVDFTDTDALVISHLHPDHMGGFKASKQRQVPLPSGCEALEGRPCYVPDLADSKSFDIQKISKPGMLPAGIGTTGPLARSLFLMGPTREQTLIARIRGKGIVVITGCGHPTIKTILAMVKRLTDEPLYAVIGGLHLPVTDSPLKRQGLKVQMIWGTGKPPWQRITDKEVDQAIQALNQAGVKHLYLSGHDICRYAIDRLDRELHADVVCLEAGQTLRI